MSTFRRALEHPFSQHVRFTTLSSLLQALFTRPMRSFWGHCTQDPDEGLKPHSQRVNNGHASLPDRLQFACEWAYVARLLHHPSISTTYDDVEGGRGTL